MKRCTLCGGVGWIIDTSDLGRPGALTLEFLPCLIPDCRASGRDVQNLTFPQPVFANVARHPVSGRVMSVSA